MIPSPTDTHGRLRGLFAQEIFGSIGGIVMTMGIFFFMQSAFGWGATRNLRLSAAQGAVYIVGALSASSVANRIGRRPMLRILNVALAGLAFTAFCFPTPAVVVCALLGYTISLAASWPLIESLVSAGANAAELSRRISKYNLIWSLTGAATMAACGTIIAHFSRGVFLVVAASHVASFVILLKHVDDPGASHAHANPEPELLPLRTLAMRLSRVALPATYAVVYALGALMPTLPVIEHYSPTIKTLIASAWMASRFAAFFLLGAFPWWHTRPRALLWAAILLLVSFVGITFTPNLAGMILWQIVLGMAIGFIYAASLYFGMVLSEGSAEHGGYHEALIGLGSILGPGSGAIAAMIRPGDQNACIVAVAIVLWASATVAAGVSFVSGKKSRN